MTYTELQKSGRKLYSAEKRGQGPYTDACAGEREIWITPDNRAYEYETNDNGFSYTGKPKALEFLSRVNDVSRLEHDLNAKTYTEPMSGLTLSVNANYFDELFYNLREGRY